MSKTFRIEIIIPYVVDELDTVEEAEAYGEYLANANGIVGMGTEVTFFEVRAEEVVDNDDG